MFHFVPAYMAQRYLFLYHVVRNNSVPLSLKIVRTRLSYWCSWSFTHWTNNDAILSFDSVGSAHLIRVLASVRIRIYWWPYIDEVTFPTVSTNTSFRGSLGIGLCSLEIYRGALLRWQVSHVERSLTSMPSSPNEHFTVFLRMVWPGWPSRWCQRFVHDVLGTLVTPGAIRLEGLASSNGWI